MVDLTPEGEIVLKALEVHRSHLESHECRQCLSSYETVLNAVTAWVRSQPKEESHGEQKEGGEEKAKIPGHGPFLDPKKDKEPWDIFG